MARQKARALQTSIRRFAGNAKACASRWRGPANSEQLQIILKAVKHMEQKMVRRTVDIVERQSRD